jgi:hypothetical protein
MSGQGRPDRERGTDRMENKSMEEYVRGSKGSDALDADLVISVQSLPPAEQDASSKTSATDFDD